MPPPTQILVFGIPVDLEYRGIARLAWADLRLWIENGSKDLTPADRARTELVSIISDELRRQGIRNPLATAWDRVGYPDPQEFPRKLNAGQPLGDLSQQAVLDQFAPLIKSRLKFFSASGNDDAEQAAKLGLLGALASYNPAIDGSVGTFALFFRHIDDAIKSAIRGDEIDGDTQSQEHNVSGDSVIEYDEGESGDRWGVLPTTLLPDAIADGIDLSLDGQNRLHRNRLPFWVQCWTDQTRPRREFGARVESWMDAPCEPQDIEKALAKISPDKIAKAMAGLDEKSREIIVVRFGSKPPILLSAIARGELNPKSKTSYKEVLNIAYRAAVKIDGQFEVKRPKARPMRQPPPPRWLPTKPWVATAIQQFWRWRAWYEIRR